MDNFTRVLRIGRNSKNMSLWVTVQYKDKRLSITGVEGPLKNGDARGSCGQCIDMLDDVKTYSSGWNETMVNALKAVWQQFHLNDLIAGSPMQVAFLKANDHLWIRDSKEYTSHYDWAVDVLFHAGLQPDYGHMVDGQPYKYGSRWLSSEVSESVLHWLKWLPISDALHPWNDVDSFDLMKKPLASAV